MTQYDQIAVAALASGEINAAIGNRTYARAGRCCVVDPLVGAPFLQ